MDNLALQMKSEIIKYSVRVELNMNWWWSMNTST